MPEDILELDTQLHIESLNIANEKRLGLSRSQNKVVKLNELATDSFGISFATDVFKLEIHIMLEQIQLIENQIVIVEDGIKELVAKQDNYLTTITGICPVTAAVILGEVGGTSKPVASFRRTCCFYSSIW